MGTRVTLEMPNWLAQRLMQESCDSGRSVAKVIIDALWDSDLTTPDLDNMTPQERMNWEFRDISEPWTDEDDALMANVFGDDSDIPEMTHEELWELMPKLPPEKWLSKALIEDREDRI
ncbi:MAG: hypothetical protein AB7R89_28150 [Dehalococcoidia bacterium]